jgi:tRNA modification GTPase
VRATISIQGVPVHLVDTAGLRAASDEIERLGIERTWRAVQAAGAALFVTEPDRPLDEEELAHLARLPADVPVARVVNKIDLTAAAAGREASGDHVVIRLSARTGAGVEALRAWLLEVAGWKPHGEGVFIARQRHLIALGEAGRHLAEAQRQTQAFELMAEELRLAQAALGRITGEVGADDLLGAIFSRFCIGK